METHTFEAVFLSYAREDATSARRIAEALRSSGIEVWFDENELRGGDAWDQKIRRQIKDCSLFLAIISAHTQERGEGYFRLEWKLAVERMDLMAEGVPFLVPVGIDDVSEGAAVVPEPFRRVQWTRLPGALPTPQFVEQVQRLLQAPRKPVPTHGKAGPGGEREPTNRQRIPWWVVGAAAAVVIAVIGYFAVRVSTKEVVVPKSAATGQKTTAKQVNAKSIAVLPFVNRSTEKGNEFFTDGMHDDILNHLSLIRDLRVISRTSVEQYRGTNKTMKQVGEELDVAYVLEGSVQREGNKVRVTGQLIRAATDQHVWAKAYDRNLSDTFAVQSELAQAIAGELRAVVLPQEKALIERIPTTNQAAHDLYLKSRALLSGPNRERRVVRLERIRVLNEAVKLDRDFAKAWAELSQLLTFDNARSGVADATTLAEGRAALDRAVALAPEQPETLVAQGLAEAHLFQNYERAKAFYQRVLQLHPNDAAAHLQLAYAYINQLRPSEAIAPYRESLRLDPGARGNFFNFGVILKMCRRYDDLQTELRRFYAGTRQLDYELGLLAFLTRGTTDELNKHFAGLSVPERKWSSEQIKWVVTTGNRNDYMRWLQARPTGAAPSATDGFNFQNRLPLLSAEVRRDFHSALFRAASGDLAGARSELGRIDELRKLVAKLTGSEAAHEFDIDIPNARRALLCELAQWEALLGEKDAALRHAREAVESKPASRNAWVEPYHNVALVFVYAWTGERDLAIDECAGLLRTTYSPLNVHVMKRHPAYAPLRGDPRFEALLNDPKNNAPLF